MFLIKRKVVKLKTFENILDNFLRPNKYIHYLFKMNRAYLRHSIDGEHFDISFEYRNENPKIIRKFNFSRKLSESSDSFLTRVAVNVDKAINKKSKKKPAADFPNSSSAVLSINNIEVPKETPCHEIFCHDNIILTLNENKFSVVINSPWVETINLPDCILANFPTYPTKFKAVYTDKNTSEFIWYKSKKCNIWEEVGKGYIYTPKNTDIDYFLKLCCIPKREEIDGPTVEYITKCTVQASPGECPFERRQMFTKDRLQEKEFRVVTYNILADLYCDSDHTREKLFPYCPPYALSIDYRKQLFLKEIIGYNADLICLQEVDKKVYKYDLEPTLLHLGYSSTFHLKGGEIAEGLAFFYNKNRFILLDSERFLFSERIDKEPLFVDIWKRISQNSQLTERILARTTTLQINVIGSLENNEVLVVANTHLYFHPDADHIRLLHGCLAIRYLENLMCQLKERYTNKRVSLIFCGDFNSVPECGIYKLYTEGFVPGNFIDYSSNKDEIIENIDMKHTFKLASACGTPKYTNFTADFADCLDYIFYDKSSLAVTQVVPLPSVEELNQNTALPSIVFPSDHVSLVSDLKWV